MSGQAPKSFDDYRKFQQKMKGKGLSPTKMGELFKEQQRKKAGSKKAPAKKTATKKTAAKKPAAKKAPVKKPAVKKSPVARKPASKPSFHSIHSVAVMAWDKASLRSYGVQINNYASRASAARYFKLMSGKALSKGKSDEAPNKGQEKGVKSFVVYQQTEVLD